MNENTREALGELVAALDAIATAKAALARARRARHVALAKIEELAFTGELMRR